MYAADDRIGAMFNENTSGATPEWVEWDLNGAVLQRTLLTAARRLQSRRRWATRKGDCMLNSRPELTPAKPG